MSVVATRRAKTETDPSLSSVCAGVDCVLCLLQVQEPNSPFPRPGVRDLFCPRQAHREWCIHAHTHTHMQTDALGQTTPRFAAAAMDGAETDGGG